MTFLVWFQLNFLTFFLMCSTYFNFDFFFIHLKRNMKSGDRSKGGCDCCNNILDEAVVYPTLTGRHFFARFDFVLRYFCFVCVCGGVLLDGLGGICVKSRTELLGWSTSQVCQSNAGLFECGGQFLFCLVLLNWSYCCFDRLILLSFSNC